MDKSQETQNKATGERWYLGQRVHVLLGPYAGQYVTIVAQYMDTWEWIRAEVDGDVARWFRPGELAPVNHPTHIV